MTKKQIASGVAHKVPDDLYTALTTDKSALVQWESLTPLSRNEWICWNISVKQQKTRDEHIKRTVKELNQGKRRPCCWVGCIHRTDKKPGAWAQKVLIDKVKLS